MHLCSTFGRNCLIAVCRHHSHQQDPRGHAFLHSSQDCVLLGFLTSMTLLSSKWHLIVVSMCISLTMSDSYQWTLSFAHISLSSALFLIVDCQCFKIETLSRFRKFRNFHCFFAISRIKVNILWVEVQCPSEPGPCLFFSLMSSSPFCSLATPGCLLAPQCICVSLPSCPHLSWIQHLQCSPFASLLKELLFIPQNPSEIPFLPKHLP